MQAIAIQAAAQPFSNLVQANVNLMSKFVMSPEVTNQAMNDAQKLFQQAQDSAGKLIQTHAFAGVMQGLMENYNQFFTELFQTASATFGHSQAAFMQHAQEATNSVVNSAQASARRVRSAG